MIGYVGFFDIDITYKMTLDTYRLTHAHTHTHAYVAKKLRWVELMKTRLFISFQ